MSARSQRLFVRYFWLVSAIISAVVGASWLHDLLAPPDVATSGPALRAIWLTSAALAVVGLIFAVLDLRRIAQEDRQRTTETRRKTEASTTEVDWQWLTGAHRRTALELAPLGATTRAIAGSLLLMAVLGTFAGMGEAVPSLATAVEAVVSQDKPIASADLGRALKNVADAFGANFLALLAAAVLGLASFGASRARADIHLEVVGSLDELMRSRSNKTLPTDDLREAAKKLSDAAVGIGEVRDSLRELKGSFDHLLHTLPSAISSGLRNQVEVRLHSRLADELNASTKNLGLVAEALAGQRVAYEGLVTDWDRRTASLDGLAATLSGVAKETSSALAGVGRDVGVGISRLADALTAADATALALADKHSREWAAIDATIGRTADGLAKAVESLGEAQERTADLQKLVAEAGDRQLGELGRLIDATGAEAGEIRALTSSFGVASAEMRQASTALTGGLRSIEELSARSEATFRAELVDGVSSALAQLGASSLEVVRQASSEIASAGTAASGRVEKVSGEVLDVLQSLQDSGVRVGLADESKQTLSEVTRSLQALLLEERQSKASLNEAVERLGAAAQAVAGAESHLSTVASRVEQELSARRAPNAQPLELSERSIARLAAAIAARRGWLGLFRRG